MHIDLAVSGATTVIRRMLPLRARTLLVGVYSVQLLFVFADRPSGLRQRTHTLRAYNRTAGSCGTSRHQQPAGMMGLKKDIPVDNPRTHRALSAVPRTRTEYRAIVLFLVHTFMCIITVDVAGAHDGDASPVPPPAA